MSIPRTIAVDGPAGSGKSSVSFEVARRLGYIFVDTGAFYRMITLAAVWQGIAKRPEAEIVALAEQLQLDISPALKDDGRQYTALLNGQDVTVAIRGESIKDDLSDISKMPGVRRVVNSLQQVIAGHQQVIMVGRDIGTVVLPGADLKIYLDASLDVRAQRRCEQERQAGRVANFKAIRDELEKRDLIDSTRPDAPLRQAKDALYVDSTTLSEVEVVERFVGLIRDWKPAKVPGPTGG
jgi:cytidylate kinase